jgi:hypothetical protein
MDQIKILALLKEASTADFKRKNEIAAEINQAVHQEAGACVAIFNLLYVQFCQEAPSLLPYLFPFVSAIAGDREEGLFANRIDMGLFTFMLDQDGIARLARARHLDRQRVERYQSRSSGRDDE